ncbi:autotransporter outer membrane beta-barrel domain-containing protein [Phytopseudomonas daroniae]|uniref:autotransporter outer membrane beta-barrel domain-containing protein n=1 Tax=Phytopseudomonas daroniae TaxID=2487519 RepID=UPI001ABEEA43|nr:autotransporter outer membrane beta-barrel domain-containing protein [Pseudomonas daroniae]
MLANRGAVDNAGAITGGTGGDGIYGGHGGSGLRVNGTAVSNAASGVITGGQGGNSTADPRYNAGNGGTGITFINDGGSLDNQGSIAGGAGGSNATPGLGGVGVLVESNGTTLLNAGSIAGGLGGDGSTRANAVELTGSDNTLELHSGYSFTGNVVTSGSGNVLALGGTVNASFNVGQLGNQYQGFDSYQKTGASTWTLTGATMPTAAATWRILAGTVQVGAEDIMSGSITGLHDSGAGTDGGTAIQVDSTDAAGLTVATNGSVSGGAGGNGVSDDADGNGGIRSGNGGTAIAFDSNGTLRNSGDISGGAGGASIGGDGGDGGTAVAISGGLFEVADGRVAGGEGGFGSIRSGQGGTAVEMRDDASLNLSGGAIAGGNGGGGVSDSSGDGGTAVTMSGATVLTLADGTITGGNGGDNDPSGGDGGTAVAMISDDARLNLSGGVISGGRGGNGTNSGAGGTGLVMSGATALTLADGTITGGNGGDGPSGGDGGTAVAMSNDDARLRLNGATIAGGNGGDGGGGTITDGEGGNGGTAVAISGGLFEVADGMVTGGNGGTGPNSGNGGDGVAMSGNASLSLSGGTISGGAGGNGGDGGHALGLQGDGNRVDLGAGTITGGNGGSNVIISVSDNGNGGNGLNLQGNDNRVTLGTGTLTGGDGGGYIDSFLGFDSNGGNGGNGLSLQGTGNSVDLGAGTITGGNGGDSSDSFVSGNGGAGLKLQGDDNSVTVAASIAGGLSGDGSTRANAIEINGDDNTLELRSGSTLDGDVVASGSGNALLLDGNGSANSGFSGFSTLQASAGSNWTLSGALGITSGGLSIDVVDSGSLRLDGPLTGSGGLTLTSSVAPSGYGFGTLSISGDNTYTGDTRIGGGDVLTYVLATNSNAFGTGTVTVADKGQLDLSPPSGGTFSNDLIIGNGGNVTLEPTVTLDEQAISIESGGGLSASGSDLAGATLHNAGSLALSARRIGDPDNGFTNIAVQGENASVINDATGVLNLTGSASTGIALGSLSGGGTVVLGAANLSVGALDNDDTISGTIQDLYPEDHDLGTGGSLTKVGSGSLTLTGTNTYTGGTTIAAGTLVGSAASFGSGDIVNDAILVFDQAAEGTYAGGISGSGVLNKRGAGTLILDGSGSNIYTGTTTVQAGGLIVGASAGNGASLGGDVAVESGALLGGHGLIGGDVTIASGATLAPGAGSGTGGIGTLSIDGDLTLASGSTLAYGLGAPGTATLPGSSDRVAVGGDLSLDGTLNLSDAGGAGLGYYRLMTYGGTLDGNGLTLGITTPVEPALYSIQAGNGNVDLFVAANGDDTLQHWQGGDGTWNGASAQWLNQDGDLPVAWAGNHAVFKDANGFQGGTITLEGTQAFAGLQFVDQGYRLVSAPGLDGLLRTDGSSEIRVLADSAEIAAGIVGNGGIVKTEAGTLILSGANSYSGGTTIAAGTLTIYNDASLGDVSGDLTLDGGALSLVSSRGSATLEREIILGDNGGTFSLGSNQHMILDGEISGSGDLIKEGAGTLAITNAANSYSGNTLIHSGAISLENGGSLGSGSVTLASLAAGTGSGNLSVGRDSSLDGLVTLIGLSSILRVNGSAGDASIINSGGGSQVLFSGSDSDAGTARVINENGAVSFSNGANAANATVTNAANSEEQSATISVDGANLGSATLVNLGEGPYNSISFAGDSDASDATLINNGNGQVIVQGDETGTALSIGSLSGSGSVALQGGWDYSSGQAVPVPVSLTLGALGNYDVIDGSIYGDGSLSKAGSGTLILNGSNTYTGGTRVQAGSLIVGASAGSAASLGGDVTVEGGALLGGHGLIGGDVTIASGATLSPGIDSGTAGVGTLSIGGDLTLASGSTLAYQLGVPGTATLPGSSDRVAVSGDLSLDGTLNLSDAGGAGLGYYRLMTYGGALDDNGLTPGTNLAEPALYTIQAGNGNVDLFVAASGDATLQHWQGGDGTWNGASAQWLNQDGNLPVAWAGNHAVFKDANGFEGGTITLEGTQAFAGLQFVNEGYSLVSAPGLDGLLRTDGSSEIRVLADSAEIAVGIVGNGGIVKTEAGTLILDGNNTYTGDTSVQAGGLTIGGSAGSGASLTSDVNVWDGARLGGHGSIVGNVNLADGATLAPGNSIGTLTVDGDVSFAPSAVFEVEANPDGTADKLVATGTVTLGDSTLNVLAGAGDWSASTRYDLVEAGNLVGTFGTVNSNLAFLNADLAYDYALNTVELTLLRNDTAFASVARTFNQTATASALSSLDPTSGLATAITALSEEGARDAYDSLSGELHASLQSALLDDSRYLREGVNARLLAAQHLLPGSGQLNQGDGVTFWLQGYGGWARNEGDGNASTLDHDSRGTLFGGDIALDDAWRIGAAIGLGSSDLKDGRDSSADVDTRSLALYASGQWDAVKLRVGASHSWHDVDTRRNVHFGSFSERNKASYDATTTQAFAELGYRLAAADFQVEPFIGLAHAKVKSDGFSERGGDSALSAGNEKRDITYSTLGAHAALPVGQFAGSPVSLQGSLGWQHAFGNDTPDSHLAFTTGDAFSIRGTPLERDSAVAQLGIQTQLNRNIAVDLSYSGRFGEDFTDNGLRLGLTAKF